MWGGFDPRMLNELATIRGMVMRQQQTPTREWPLVYVEEHDAVLVVREWPDGSITGYATDAKTLGQ